MDTESNRKTTRLARISLVLGILSFGLFLFACLSLIWIKLSPFNESTAILFVSWAFMLFLGSLIVGLPGLILAVIALVRIIKDGSDNKTQRTVIIGLVLGGVGTTFVLFYLAFVLLFDSSTPSPVAITPSSIIPLAP